MYEVARAGGVRHRQSCNIRMSTVRMETEAEEAEEAAGRFEPPVNSHASLWRSLDPADLESLGATSTRSRTSRDMADEGEEVANGEPKADVTRDDVSVTLMGNVLEKLRVLEYDKELGSKKKGFTPYTETQFAIPASTNAGAQFKSFLDLAGFLLRLAGHELSVDKYDDPGTSVNKLVLSLKALGFPLDFPAARLRTGAGEACCAALDFLADRALAAKGVAAWPRPAYPKEDFADEAEVDDEAEVVDGDADDDGGRAHAVDDGDELMYSDVVQLGAKATAEDPLEASTNQMIVSEVDPLLWRTELERVGPKLRARTAGLSSSSLTSKASSGSGGGDSGPVATKEWHSHLERTRTHADVVAALRPTATTQLRAINAQLAEASTRLASGEDKLSNQFFENRRAECRELREQLNKATERGKEGGDRVDAMTRELAALGEQLRAAKSELDSRGAKMTDTSPLVRIKEALRALAAEIKQFELRIGVVGHTLLQAKARQASRRTGGGRSGDGAASGYQDPEFDQSDEDSS